MEFLNKLENYTKKIDIETIYIYIINMSDVRNGAIYHLWSQELGAATAILVAVWLEAIAAVPTNVIHIREAKTTSPL